VSREPNQAIAASHGSVPNKGNQLPRAALPETVAASSSKGGANRGLTILSMDSVCRLRASPVHSFSASLHSAGR